MPILTTPNSEPTAVAALASQAGPNSFEVPDTVGAIEAMGAEGILDAMGRPMADLRISLTDRCNLNCSYCMPKVLNQFLPKQELLSFEEIARVVNIVSQLGVHKVKLTGGEPLLRSDCDQLVAMLSQNPRISDIGLISNGIFIPEFGPKLKNAGLDRISISLDSLDYQVFQKIVGNHYHVGSVLAGVEAAEQLGFAPIKINCVMQRGVNDSQILPLAEYFRRPGFHLRFIEFMDVGKIAWNPQRVVPSAEILDIIGAKYPLRPVGPHYYGEVADRYVYTDIGGHASGSGTAEIGFISAVSKPFCRSCTRLRLSSDGKLYKCLFSSDGFDVKRSLRSHQSDSAIRSEITAFWVGRDDRYSERRFELHDAQQRKAMNFMGG